MEENDKLAIAQGQVLDDPSRHQRQVGRVIYLTITTTELCYAVHILSQFRQPPKEQHFEASCRVLRYLKDTPGYGILLRSHCDLQIRAYCDVD